MRGLIPANLTFSHERGISMKRSYLALAIAGAALAISASGPAYAQPADDTVAPIAAAPEAMPVPPKRHLAKPLLPRERKRQQLRKQPLKKCRQKKLQPKRPRQLKQQPNPKPPAKYQPAAV